MTATLRTAQLSPSRSAKRAIVYDQATGVLAIATGTRCRRFVVEERYTPAGESGRVFRLTRVGGIGDDHDVLLATDRRASSCSCAGHSYEASEKANRRAAERGDAVVATLGCCHLDGIAFLIDQGWMPDPRCCPDQDVGSTETYDQDLPECFRGLYPDQIPGVPF